ncbi:MAG TPA: glycoside hydrolase family 13 protein [Candidatus Blautia gallistercoris]|uniref:Glycoside hydrolase family 13 protein n=1 Tax=Candidatus Blautia gallistercoris TaxID=2838490 RepID=A0A9D1WHP5_9FIRM|nr:glycoside hydrolase family 13 protein [Candidatus Blautia gallistercoris]
MEIIDTYSAKAQQYILQMRPVFNKDALFSDETENYRSPMEPDVGDIVTIRFRTLRNNVDAVYMNTSIGRIRMRWEKCSHGFDYYAMNVTMTREDFFYSFEIHFGRICCYYNKKGVCLEKTRDDPFHIVPGFKTPDWAKGAVIYQIFVDRFYNGDKSNDVLTGEYCYIGDISTRVEDWNKFPATMGVREFYGGDLQGIIDKLDYLQSLGVEVLYLNPIFVSPSNHKYDSQDYDYVDPHYGVIVNDGGELLYSGDRDNSHATRYIKRVTDRENLEASNQLFIKMVEEIHKRGMKIILDGVFNHCGSFNKWLDRERIYENQEGYAKGAYISADSPYRNYFKFHDESQWPYNTTYDGWWAHDTLPKLNYEASPELYQYILDVAKKWVSPPYNIDGWRLDVAADLGHSNEFNHRFWKDFRRAVKSVKPDALILAEHYGDPRGWLQGDEWDTVMNYDAFMEPVTWFLTGMEKHSDEYRGDLLGNSESFIGAMRTHMASFHVSSLQTAMNELSNHDHSRFLTRTNRTVGRVSYMGPEAAAEGINKAVLREAVVIQMTWPGAPTIYYGDEAGVCGFTDPDNRRTYPWGQEDQDLLTFHRDIIQVHRKYKVLVSGSLRFLWNDHQGLSYCRFSHEDRMIIALNNSETDKHMEIPVWLSGLGRLNDVKLQCVFYTGADSYYMGGRQFETKAGFLELNLPPYSAILLYHKDEEE